MPTEYLYEISAYRNGQWEVIGNETNKTTAKNTAHHFLASKHYKNVRIIEEILDPKTDEFTTRIIFSQKSTQVLKDSVPDKGTEFWQGRTEPVSHSDPDVSEISPEDKLPGQNGGREFINRIVILILVVGGVFTMLGGLIYFYLGTFRPLLE